MLWSQLEGSDCLMPHEIHNIPPRTNKTPEQCGAIAKQQGIGGGAARPSGRSEDAFSCTNMMRCRKLDKMGTRSFLHTRIC